jgi:cardiolipin synthase
LAIVTFGARLLYDHLLRAGVHIYEYCERPLHGKVATVDDTWATVGSSNLDPLSLSLNLEANVVMRDAAFNATLRERLGHLMQNCCKEIHADAARPRAFGQVLLGFFVFHFLRRFPQWATALPKHRPVLNSLRSEESAS